MINSRTKLVVVGGMPATGKSTLVRQIARGMGKSRGFSYRLVRGRYYEDQDIYLLGIYDDKIYSGTDRLSMAVQPDVEKFLSKIKKGSTVMCEGDRLFTRSFFSNVLAMGMELQLFILDISESEQVDRRAERKDTKSGIWLSGRETKIANAKAEFEHFVLPHSTHEDMDAAASRISSELGVK